MADYSRAGLAAAAGVDPWALHEQVRTGDAGALQVGALRVRRGGSLAADAAADGERADRDLAAAFHNDGTGVHDAVASTRQGDQLLADRGDKIEEAARAVLDVAGALSDTATSTASRISDLDAELNRIIGLRDSVQVTGPGPAAVAALGAAELRYFGMAVDAVRVTGGRVRADLDDYDAVLRNRTARLKGLGYGAPAPARPAGFAGAARAVAGPGEPGEPDGPEPDLIAQLASFFGELGAAIASALGGPPAPTGIAAPALGLDSALPAPAPNREPGGLPERVPKKEGEDKRGIVRQNESARILARAGYDITQLPKGRVIGQKNPDYRGAGRIFDNYAPMTGSAGNAQAALEKKVEESQADRFIVNLHDTTLTPQDLRTQLRDHPPADVKEVIVIDQQERISYVYP